MYECCRVNGLSPLLIPLVHDFLQRSNSLSPPTCYVHFEPTWRVSSVRSWIYYRPLANTHGWMSKVWVFHFVLFKYLLSFSFIGNLQAFEFCYTLAISSMLNSLSSCSNEGFFMKCKVLLWNVANVWFTLMTAHVW